MKETITKSLCVCVCVCVCVREDLRMWTNEIIQFLLGDVFDEDNDNDNDNDNDTHPIFSSSLNPSLSISLTSPLDAYDGVLSFCLLRMICSVKT